MTVLPRLTDNFNAITIKISGFLIEVKKGDSSILYKGKENRIAKDFWKEEQTERVMVSDSRLIKSYCNQSNVNWWKDRHISEWSRTQSLEINVHKQNQLIFDKGSRIIQWRKDTLV